MSMKSASFTESGRELHVVEPQISNERSPNLCMHCVCLKHWLSFSTWVPVQSLIEYPIPNPNLSAKDTDTYFKSQLYVEDPGPPAVDGIRAHNLVIDNLWLIIRRPPLLVNFKYWKGLISGNGFSLDSQTLWRYFAVISISKSHMFI